MGHVRIVTDSSAEIDQDLADALGIVVVPLNVHMGDEVYHDGADVTAAQVMHRLAREGCSPPYTSPPPVATFRSVYDKIARTSNEIISIHLSGKLSDTVRRASEAAESFAGYSRIAIIDSRLASWGLGLLVVEAARAAAAGAALDEIVRTTRGMISRIYVVFYVDTLEHLLRGGRVAKADALAGSSLNIKPVFILENGENAPLESARTMDNAMDRLVEFVLEFPSLQHVSIVYGQLDRQAHALLDRLQEECPEQEFQLRKYGAAMTVHLGPNCIGVVAYEGP